MYMYDVLDYFLQHAKQRGRDKESVEEEAAHLKDSVSDLTEENHELKKKMYVSLLSSSKYHNMIDIFSKSMHRMMDNIRFL